MVTSAPTHLLRCMRLKSNFADVLLSLVIQELATKQNAVTYIGYDHIRVLDWWLDLLDSLIQRVVTLYSSLLHIYYCPQSRLHCRCFATASNGGLSPSPVFPTCPLPQLPASNNSSQLLTLSSFLTNCNRVRVTLLLAFYRQAPWGFRPEIYFTTEPLQS
jgi:hypothetical protein